jgi:hypothetical protein
MPQPTLNSSASFDWITASNSTGAFTTGANTFTVPGGLVNACLIFKCATVDTSSDPGSVVSSIAFGAQSGTAITGSSVERLAASDRYVQTQGYELRNPTAGTNPITGVGTFPAFFGLGLYVQVTVELWENVDQTTPWENVTTAGSTTDQTSMTLSVTNSSNNVAIGQCIAYDATTLAVSGGGTAVGTVEINSGSVNETTLAQYNASVNPTLTWTKVATTSGNARWGASLRGTSSGGSTSIYISFTG